MAQIVPRETISERLGAGLATGISAGLQALAQQRMQQMQQRQLANAYQSVGLPQELAYLPENIVKSFLERGGAAAFAPQTEPSAELPSAQEVPQAQPQGLEVLQALQQQYAQPLSNQQAIQQILQGGAASASPFVRQQIAQARPEVKRVLEPQVTPSATLIATQQAAQAKQKPTFADVLARPTIKEQRILDYQNKKLGLQEAGFKQKQQSLLEKKFEPYIKEIQQKASAGKEDFERLREMEELVKAGNLANPAGAALLETLSKGLWGLGIDLFGTTSKDTQRFRKLSKDFAKTAKNYFGARVTEGEIKLLLDTFPTLSQSDAGKLAIIDKLKPLAAASQVYDQALEEVLAEHNYVTPPNLRSLIENKAKPRIDSLAKEFRESAKIRDLDRKLRAESQRRKEPVKSFFRGFVPGTQERLLGIGEPHE